MARRHKEGSEKGFSLVELMIAMTLGLFLIAGMIAVFSGNKKSSELNTAMANLQENARFALNAISRDARMASFQGCLPVDSGALEYRANNTPTLNLRDSATSGSLVQNSGDWFPDPPLGFVEPTATPAIAGTHTLALQFAGAKTGTLAQQLTNGGVPSPVGDIILSGTHEDPGIEENDVAIIASCDFGDMFRASSVGSTATGNIVIQHGATHNINGTLTRPYGSASNIDTVMVAKFHSNIYFVADTGLTNESGDAITALYQQSLPYDSLTNPPTQLVLGVENMKIAFGVRDPDGTLNYVPPNATSFVPADVESLRIGLLMVSWDSIASEDDTTTYVLAGQNVPAGNGPSTGVTHATDKRFRLAFNATVKVRNRKDL